MGPGAVAPVSPHSRRPCSLFRELLLCNFPVRFAVLRFLNHEFISAPALLRSSKSPAEISDTESPMMYTVYSTLYTASQPGQTNSAVACKTSLPMSQKTRPLSHRIQKGQHIDGRDTPPLVYNCGPGICAAWVPSNIWSMTYASIITLHCLISKTAVFLSRVRCNIFYLP